MKKLITVLLVGFLMPGYLFSQAKMQKHRDGGPAKAVLFEINRTKDPATGKVPRDKYLQALQKTVDMKADAALRGTAAFTWTERGPISDVPGPSNGNTRANSGLASGRIRAVMVDSTDATKKTVWIGGVDGGLWKTTDITATSPTWTLVNDFLSNLAVAAICQDPRPGFQNIMYFCTGESYYNADAVQGVGVFKSTNGGVTWSFLPSTSAFVNGTRILCDYQGNVYLATRGSGLRRSTDGGTTWTNITPTGLVSDICDLEISSTSAAGRLHVVSGIFTTQAYRYTDIPATVTSAGWTAPAAAFPSYSMRCEIAVSGSTLYACPVDNSYMVPTIYKSTNGGANWAATTAQPTAGWTNGQGWYDVEVGIDPSNSNNVIVGGLDTYKTTNGGTSWTKMSEWVGTVGQYVHADIHKISWWDGGNKLVVASDGGVFYSSDKGTTIRDRNLGLRIKQFYSVAIHPTTTNYFIAGAQDNGNHQFSNAGLSTSIEITGGDGAFVDIDQNQPQYQYGAYVYNVYRRSTNSGANWSTCSFYKGSAGTKYVNYFDFGSFINPFDYDNTNNVIYAGADAGEFFRWTTAQTTAAGTYYSNTTFPAGASIVSGITGFNGAKVSTVFVSPYTANLVYFGTEAGRVVSIAGANTAANGTAGTNITGASFPAANVSCINAGTNDNNLIVSFSNYGVSNVWVSTNGGTAWTAIDGNLPNMPVRWCMFYPGSNTKAIIATETGVWQTDLINGASTVWVAETTFPTVRTDMLQYRALDGTIAAATHGRGLWTTTLCTPPPVSVNPTTSVICNPGGTGITLTASGATTYTWSPATGLSATTGASVVATPTETTTYTVTGTDGAGCSNSANTTVTVAVKPTVTPVASPATVCSGGNSILDAGATFASPTYCSTSYISGTGFGDWISLVQIASTTLNNPSAGAASPYYTLYPATGSTTASLAANTAYTMTVSGGTFATCLIRGWIDYNQDGVFSAAESIGVSPNVGASATGTIIFTPPLTALNGQTRMRLRSSDTSPGPGTGDFCNATNSDYGETEDYIITITGGVSQFTYLWTPSTFLSSTTASPTNANTVTATTNYTVTATGSNGCSATGNVTVTVNTVTVTNPVTATGTAGVPFSQTFTQSGAIGGVTFTINSGTLPTGLTLSTAGVLNGTPTQTGTFPITVRATGGNGCFGNGVTYNLVISCQAITVTNPGTATGTAGVPFSQTFTQSGAIGGVTFTINSGTLPTGLTLSTAGVLSGTPTQTGTFPITVRATGGNGCFGNGGTYNLVISCQAITVTNPATTTGTSGVFFSQTFTQTGAVGGATFTINSGTLPTGLTLSTAGVLSGTPTQTGTFPITVRATGGNGCIGNGSTYNLVINTAFTTLNLKVYLQGFYAGGGLMVPNLFDLGLSGNPAAADNITVNLWSPASLSSPTPNYTMSALLLTSGNTSVQFPAGVAGNSFYIAVKHRNHMETWSKTPIAFTSTTSYDFSNALSKAYDDGVNPPMANVAAGVYAIYGGDVNKDGAIDASDMSDVDNDIAAFAFGYNDTDVTGDGATDASDLSVVDNNQSLFLFYARPF